MNIGVIVEGHGETTSVPILLRRILGEQRPDLLVQIPPPLRLSRGKITKPSASSRHAPTGPFCVVNDSCCEWPIGLRRLRLPADRRSSALWARSAMFAISSEFGWLILQLVACPGGLRDHRAMGTVSVLLLRPVVAAVDAAVGAAELDAFRATAGLPAQLAADDDARVAAPQLGAAWAEALRLTGDRQLPLRIAAGAPAGAFGLVEHVCRAAPTLGEALRQWVRYLNLLDDTAGVRLEVEEDRALLGVEREREVPAPAADELYLALTARFARELSAEPSRPIAVELAHPGPDDAAPFAAWFEAPVAFGAEATRLVLPRAALAARLVAPDPAPLAGLARATDELAGVAAADPPVTQRVKRALLDALRSDDAQVEAVAKQLGINVRSLQRRLKDEGTSFQAAREDVRRSLALRYLDDGLAVAEISFLLAFDEPAAFSRAFKRWTGLTPAEHRAQRRAAPG